MLGGKSTGEILAVDDVSLDVWRGECVGLVGESGCGKTTFSKLILRAIQADAGEIEFDGGDQVIDVRALSSRQLIGFRKRIQFHLSGPVRLTQSADDRVRYHRRAARHP